MSTKRNAAIVRKYSVALERLFFGSERTNPHDGLVEWWQRLRWERLGGPRAFRQVIASICAQVRATAIARWGKEEGHERYQAFMERVEHAARSTFMQGHVADYETLADEMAELVLLPSGMKAQPSVLPGIAARALLHAPLWAEIVHAVLTPKSWSVENYDEAECPGGLAEIIRQKVGSEPIDFEQEMLLVLSWEDRTGTWFHYVLAPRPK
jgi:hypothetical protein